METIPNGIIMILHEGFTKINPQKCINAMPEAWQKLYRKIIVVSYSEVIDLGDSHDLNFSQYALEHKRQYAEKILPVIEDNKDYQIVYFGLVSIPLGIDFGHLFYNYEKIEIYQFHNQKKEWYQEFKEEWYQKPGEDEVAQRNQLIEPILPSIDQKGIASALVRLSFSHLVKPEETEEVLSNAAEVDYGFETPGEAIINSKEKLLEIGEGVKAIFDNLSNNRSGLEVIHLFASIPSSLAFLIGTKISPNIHPYIQTYQYKNTETPKYSKAILVKKKIKATLIITEADRKNAASLRKLADEELRRHIAPFCERNKEEANGRIWPRDLIFIEDGVMNELFWSSIPSISKTGIENDQCSRTPDVIENGFIRKGNKWHIDDYFFVALNQNEKLAGTDNLRKAFRLFFFHEILHDKEHDLGNGKNENIGSFPKILETADYQADVYAILNEYGFQHRGTGNKIEYPTEFFKETIEIALETMWCFDNQGHELIKIQTRRLNRYLIWYWQLIRIEKSNNDLNGIVKILEEKPIIELTGLKINVEDNRPYLNLEQRQGKYLELAVFYNNRVIRNGSASNFQIENLIEGIKKMDSNRILNELRRFYPAFT
ncbi:MAG: SAVED domain-containing protein [Bacteroidota bacterium]